ncbi:MAG: hypothetical protein Kow0045_10070 [Albidovulum sp.]
MSGPCPQRGQRSRNPRTIALPIGRSTGRVWLSFGIGISSIRLPIARIGPWQKGSPRLPAGFEQNAAGRDGKPGLPR